METDLQMPKGYLYPNRILRYYKKSVFIRVLRVFREQKENVSTR